MGKVSKVVPPIKLFVSNHFAAVSWPVGVKLSGSAFHMAPAARDFLQRYF